jgi:hypothetical protein
MLQAYISSVSDVLDMLQMFHLNILKVDLGVIHVANGYTRMFQVFICLHICILQMFYLYVSKVDRVFESSMFGVGN